ncbi:MAG: HAD family hydrolase [Archaeoglobi archaeon]|nr:HAD family hydrolase [Candidatus Mnemosynella bozhongmuii]
MLKAVLFDFDGVIVDSFETWRHAVNDALRDAGFEPISAERFRKEFWGIELRESIKRLGLGEEVVNRANENYFKHLDKLRVREEVPEVLKELKRKYRTALVTNTPRKIIEFLLNSLHIRDFFDVIVTGDEVKLGKPHPEIILKACERLGVSPEEVVLVGDTQSDVIAGKSAGCRAIIGVGIDADFRISSLKELLEILKTIENDSPSS